MLSLSELRLHYWLLLNGGNVYNTAAVAAEVSAEVARAQSIHAPMNSLHEAYAVIREELDEFWELVKVNPSKLPLAQQQQRITNMREELVQVAAMCIRAVHDCRLTAQQWQEP